MFSVGIYIINYIVFDPYSRWNPVVNPRIRPTRFQHQHRIVTVIVIEYPNLPGHFVLYCICQLFSAVFDPNTRLNARMDASIRWNPVSGAIFISCLQIKLHFLSFLSLSLSHFALSIFASHSASRKSETERGWIDTGRASQRIPIGWAGRGRESRRPATTCTAHAQQHQHHHHHPLLQKAAAAATSIHPMAYVYTMSIHHPSNTSDHSDQYCT